MTLRRTSIPSSISRAFALAVLGVSLGGCESMANLFGYGKRAPDEFLVLSKSPLVIPPDYALRPPDTPSRTGDEPPQSALRARTLGQDPEGLGKVGKDLSPGERALLEMLGASSRQNSIRRLINNEARNVVSRNTELVENLAAPAP